MLQKVLPVQKEAARTFCVFLRYNRKQEQRQEMMERLIQGQSRPEPKPRLLLQQDDLGHVHVCLL